MEEIKNYKLKDFLKKDEETIQQYITVLTLSGTIPTKNEVFYLKLREVQDIRDHLTAGTIDNLIHAVAITEGKTYDEVQKLKILDFFRLVNSIVEQIEQISTAEQTSLSSEHPNFKWEAVNGSDKLAKFGIYNTLDTLSGGDITKYEQILDLSYSDVFTKMYMERVKADLEIEMNQLKTK